LIFSYNY